MPGRGDGHEASDEAADRAKAVLFDYIQKSDAVPRLVAAGRADAAAQDMVRACHGGVAELFEPPGMASGVLATGIMHYVLTRMLVRSQRSIRHGGVDLDIVIPDAKTLAEDPGRALVICVPKTADAAAIRGALRGAVGVQPVPGNVWLVLPEEAAKGGPYGARSFVVARDGGSFARIFAEIREFLDRTSTEGAGSRRLRILGA
ncbi:MAG: hypothetical protein OXI27_02565 [Thaumarchaeota archaeon]|nr:hypothetical protein [Nitrososphaerota archaeon]